MVCVQSFGRFPIYYIMAKIFVMLFKNLGYFLLAIFYISNISYLSGWKKIKERIRHFPYTDPTGGKFYSIHTFSI